MLKIYGLPLGTAYAPALGAGGPERRRPARPQVKQGTPATHPLTGRELRALRRQEREGTGSPFVFVSEREAPFFDTRLSGGGRTRGSGSGL